MKLEMDYPEFETWLIKHDACAEAVAWEDGWLAKAIAWVRDNKYTAFKRLALAVALTCAAPAWAGPCYRSPAERQRADETTAYMSPDQATGDPVRNAEMYRFCDTEAVIASDAAIAHAAGESVEVAAKQMADNALPAYVRCRSVQVLADTYFAHPASTPHTAYERERQACMNARGFIFGLQPR